MQPEPERHIEERPWKNPTARWTVHETIGEWADGRTAYNLHQAEGMNDVAKQWVFDVMPLSEHLEERERLEAERDENEHLYHRAVNEECDAIRRAEKAEAQRDEALKAHQTALEDLDGVRAELSALKAGLLGEMERTRELLPLAAGELRTSIEERFDRLKDLTPSEPAAKTDQLSEAILAGTEAWHNTTDGLLDEEVAAVIKAVEPFIAPYLSGERDFWMHLAEKQEEIILTLTSEDKAGVNNEADSSPLLKPLTSEKTGDNACSYCGLDHSDLAPRRLGTGKALQEEEAKDAIDEQMRDSEFYRRRLDRVEESLRWCRAEASQRRAASPKVAEHAWYSGEAKAFDAAADRLAASLATREAAKMTQETKCEHCRGRGFNFGTEADGMLRCGACHGTGKAPQEPEEAK